MPLGDNKRIAKNTLLLYFRMFLIMLVSLYTIRIVIKTLGITDYGIYNAIGGIVLFLSFLSQTISSASQRFFSYEMGRNDAVRLQKIFSSIVIIYLIIAIIIVLLAESIGWWFLNNKMVIPADRMEAARWVFHFSILTFVVSILTTPYIAIIIARENMKVYAYISIIDVLLKLLIVYFLILFAFDKLKLYSALIFIVTLLMYLLYRFYSRQYPETKFNFLWDKSSLKSVFSYSWWTLFGTLAGATVNQGSTLLLNVFFGPIANAAQSVGRQVGNAIQFFSVNIYTAVRPPLTKNYANGNHAYMMQLFYASSKAAFFLLFIVMLPLMLETKFILQLWLGEVGPYMVMFTRLTMVYVVILSLNTPITIIVQAANRVKLYHGIVDGFLLLCLPLSYLFFKINFPAQTVFFVIIVLFSLAHILRVWILKKVIPLSIGEYFIRFVVPVVGVTLLASVLSYLVYSTFREGIVSIAFVVIFSMLITTVAVFLIGVNNAERNSFILLLRRKN